MSINGTLAQANRQLGEMQFGSRSAKPSARLSAAGTLVQAIARSGAEDAEDKAKSLFETFKDSVDLGNGLERAAKDGQDALRKQKIELMAKRIEQLKELLRFATPEQAKRMLKELKQISREFKSVSKELGTSSEGLASPASGSAFQTTSSTVTANAATTSATHPSAISETQTLRDTSRTVAPPSSSAGPDAANSATSSETGQPPAWQTELSSAISSYTQSQLDSEQIHDATRQDKLRQDKEDLGKIASSMKQLADALERLAKDDDKSVRKDLKDIRANLEDGLEELRKTDLTGSRITGQTTSAPQTLASPVASGLSVSLQTTDILV